MLLVNASHINHFNLKDVVVIQDVVVGDAYIVREDLSGQYFA